jgi:3-oxoacyl-[acyl-carrier protein] reductase
MRTHTDQVALVTGASRGIGRAIALSLAGAGAYVIVNYRGNRTAADATLAALIEQGGRGELAQFDVANESQIEQSVKKIIDGHNKVDILVNNAGVTADNLLMRISAIEWDEVVGTNLKGTILCTKVVSRHMIRQRSGKILNISSVAGQMGNAGQSLYAASKAGIIGFTKTIARELASRNVTANVIAPGLIETEMTAKLSDQQREKFLQLIPLGRFGTCQEVADMVVFLAGEKAGYITGQVFSVNGGLYM